MPMSMTSVVGVSPQAVLALRRAAWPAAWASEATASIRNRGLAPLVGSGYISEDILEGSHPVASCQGL